MRNSVKLLSYCQPWKWSEVIRMATSRAQLWSWWMTARVAFGGIWLVDAFLQWQSAAAVTLDRMIAAAAHDQPSALAALINLGHSIVLVNPALANWLLTGAEASIGIALISGLHSRWALRAAIALAAAIWLWGQGLGMVFMPGATDIQSGPLYVLVSLVLLRALPEKPVREEMNWPLPGR